MNKMLESLIDRVHTWPEEAQDEAVRALSDIERTHVGVQPETAEEREAKLVALRKMISRSIERGGSYTDEEVATSISERLSTWERDRKGA
jgi:hypothetical protein